MRDYFFDGIKRLDWGFNNPNITAGLIVILMMAIWILYRIHRWGFWPSLLGFTFLGACLIQTVSRGGLVAAITSGLLLVLLAKRPWPRRRWVPILVSVVLLIGYAFWHGVASRYAQGIVEEDGSVSNRWIIYRMTPAMMVDAPSGWGMKQGSEAFHNFYQPEGRFERYGSLVSSHLTWMTEFSWWGRFGYVLGWVTILFFCLPSRHRWWYAVVMATWVAFGTAAMFTTMANRWVLWVIPVALFFGVVIERIRLKDWPARRYLLFPVGLTVTCLLLFYLVGAFVLPSDPQVSKRGGWIELGESELAQGRSWIVEPDAAVVGKAYGQKVRSLVRDSASSGRNVLIEWDSGELSPDEKDHLIFSGEGLNELQGTMLAKARQAGKWVLLNPELPTGEFLASIEEGDSPPIHVVWGEFNPGRARMIWEAMAQKHDTVSLEKVTAAGKFLPNWTDRLSQ